MIPPWFVLVAVVSLAVALCYSLVRRRYGWKFMGYWTAIFVGLMAAELLAESAGLNVTRLGDIRAGPDLAGAFAAVVVLLGLRL